MQLLSELSVCGKQHNNVFFFVSKLEGPGNANKLILAIDNVVIIKFWITVLANIYFERKACSQTAIYLS